jgi:hypothetical protein
MLPYLLALALALFSCFRADAHDPVVANAAHAPGAQQMLVGLVHAYTIADRVGNTTIRLHQLQLPDGSLVALGGDTSFAPVGDAHVAVSGHRQGHAFEVESAHVIAFEAAKSNKAAASAEGRFAILHADDFANGRSSFVYEVHDAAGRATRLALASPPHSLAPGAMIRVSGRLEADGQLTPDEVTVIASPPPQPAQATTLKAASASSVLVILANFTNSAVPAYAPAQAQQVMTSNADSVANYFREASYGLQLLNVAVTPNWMQMTIPQPSTCGALDWQNVGSAAEAASRTLGAAYDPANYDFVVYVFPRIPSCGWLGLGYIGYPHKAWINGTSSFSTLAVSHEMGHNFGLLHAASLRCAGASIGGTCAASEYGDPFDVMGNQRPMHYNAMQKSKLGWLGTASARTHAGGSATYTLSPIETPGGATYAVRVPTGSANRTYWLEYRQPIGFDAPLSAFPSKGVQVRVASPFETLCAGCDTYSDDTQLLDMTLATTTFTDAALLVGQTFADAIYGVRITVTGADAGAATVQVATGVASTTPAATTTTTIASSMNPAPVGAQVLFTATVTGSLPTGSVTFTVGGCGTVGLVGSGNVRSASCAVSALAPGTYAVTASYSGDAGNGPSSATLSQTIENDATSVSVPVYRFNTGSYHFYTASETEKNYVLATFPAWRLEGIAFYADSSPTGHDVPVYRFHTSNYHFYTASESEKNYVLANSPWFVLDGVAFYASPSTSPTTLPVYRFNAGTYHFYTISESEKSYILANVPSFRLEGIAFFTQPAPQ